MGKNHQMLLRLGVPKFSCSSSHPGGKGDPKISSCNDSTWIGAAPQGPRMLARHHQDDITFLVGNLYKPSFAPVTGWRVDPRYDVLTDTMVPASIPALVARDGNE